MSSGGDRRGDGETTRALQRAAPSDAALAWVAATVDARSIDAVEPMPGGASLAMHRVTVTTGEGDSVRLVLRRYVRPEQVAADPRVAAREAAVLELVVQIATPTPRLIGVDASGALAGTPAVLMTELSGRPDWSAGQRWMRQLVEVLDDVHAIDIQTARSLRPFSVYGQESYVLPKWVTKPAVWERAIEIFHGPILDDDRTFIHRDFYPGNVLWHRKAVSGLIDWESASVGPRSMDVAHCRYNLLYDGLDAAEVFPACGNNTPANTSIAGPTSPPSSGSSTPTVATPPPTPNRFDIETMLDRAITELDSP